MKLIIRRAVGKSLMSVRPIYAYMEITRHNKPSWVLDPKLAQTFNDPKHAASIALKWGGEVRQA